MKLTIAALVTLSFSTLATAGTVTLDYRATDPSCVDAARFADEVSAKLGFVPWDPAAERSVRVRVERDGDHFTGTFRNADGSAKVIDGTTCPEVTASLAVTAAAALDRNAPMVKAAAPAPAPAPAVADDGKVPIKFTSSDGGHIDVALETGTAYGIASNGTQIAASSFSNLCTSPCTTRLQPGRSYLLFTDPDASAIGGDNFRFDQPTTITATHESRHGLRRNLLIAGLAVTALSAYALDVGFSDNSTGGSPGTIVLGSVGISVGLTMLILPLWIHDTFSFTSAPGT